MVPVSPKSLSRNLRYTHLNRNLGLGLQRAILKWEARALSYQSWHSQKLGCCEGIEDKL